MTQAPLEQLGRLPWRYSPGKPPSCPPMQGSRTSPQAKVQHLSQNGYLSLTLSLLCSGVRAASCKQSLQPPCLRNPVQHFVKMGSAV